MEKGTHLRVSWAADASRGFANMWSLKESVLP